MLRHLLVLSLFAAPAVHAQAADSVRHFPAAALRQVVAGAPDEAPHALYAQMMLDAGGYTVTQIRRTASGEAEVHADWTDVIVVQEGAATLLAGGAVSGGRQTAPGELRGGQIAGGTRRPLGPGDVVTIPAGIPHQVVLDAGQSVAYLAVKVRREAAPTP